MCKQWREVSVIPYCKNHLLNNYCTCVLVDAILLEYWAYSLKGLQMYKKKTTTVYKNARTKTFDIDVQTLVLSY